MASRRRHVNPIKAFRLALSDAPTSNGPSGGDEASLLIGLMLGFWWTIAGVPAGRLDDEASK
jgi:hypothetical protein